MSVIIDLNSVCLICLCDEGTEFHSIYEQDNQSRLTLLEKLSHFTDLDPKSETAARLPDRICGGCVEDLSAAWRLKQNCDTAYQVFQDLTQQHQQDDDETTNAIITSIEFDNKRIKLPTGLKIKRIDGQEKVQQQQQQHQQQQQQQQQELIIESDCEDGDVDADDVIILGDQIKTIDNLRVMLNNNATNAEVVIAPSDDDDIDDDINHNDDDDNDDHADNDQHDDDDDDDDDDDEHDDISMAQSDYSDTIYEYYEGEERLDEYKTNLNANIAIATDINTKDVIIKSNYQILSHQQQQQQQQQQNFKKINNNIILTEDNQLDDIIHEEHLIESPHYETIKRGRGRPRKNKSIELLTHLPKTSSNQITNNNNNNNNEKENMSTSSSSSPSTQSITTRAQKNNNSTIVTNRINIKTINTSKRKSTKTTKSPDARPPKICEICGNSYKYQHALIAHMRRHNNERPFSCEFCDKSFVSGVELRRHMRVHTRHKPYSCKFCDRRFSDFGSRIKHERTHTGERPYNCSTCGKTFAYAHVLSVHLRTHTGEKRFPCSYCDVGFTKKAYLLAHINTYHGNIATNATTNLQYQHTNMTDVKQEVTMEECIFTTTDYIDEDPEEYVDRELITNDDYAPLVVKEETGDIC